MKPFKAIPQILALTYDSLLNGLYFSLMNDERLQSPLGLGIIIFNFSAP